MANVLEILIKAVDQASGVLDKIGQSGEAAAKKVEIPWKAVGMAIAGAGVSLEALARSQEKLSVSTRQLANDVGLTTDQVRELAISVADASTPLEDVIALMDLAQKGGVTSAQGLKEYASFWAIVGKATGENSVQLAEAAVGLRALGIEAGNVADAEAALAYITDQTTISAGEFLNFVSRLAPELAAAGLTIDDVAKYMAALEDRGITGKKAVSEFGKAFDQSKGNISEMNKILGISKTDLDKYTKSIKDNAGAMREDAAIVDQAKTPFEHLQNLVGELTYKYGDLIGKAASFAPALMAIGPAITIFDALKGSSISLSSILPMVSGGIAGIVPAAGAALAAVAPFIPAILAIVAAAALLYTAWTQNWGGIQEKTRAVADFVMDRFDSMKDAFGNVGDGLGRVWDKLGEAFGKLYPKLDTLFQKITGGTSIMEAFGKVVHALGVIWDTVWDVIGIVFEKTFDLIIGGIDWLTDAIGKLIDFFSALADNPIVKWLRDQLGPAVEWIGDTFETSTSALETWNQSMAETGVQAEEMAGQVASASAEANSAWAQGANKLLTVTTQEVGGSGSTVTPGTTPTPSTPANQAGKWFQTDSGQWYYTDARGVTYPVSKYGEVPSGAATGGAPAGGGGTPSQAGGGFGTNDTGTGSDYTYAVWGKDPSTGKTVQIGIGSVSGADSTTGQGGQETIKYFDWYLQAMGDQADAAEDATDALEEQTDATQDAAALMVRATEEGGEQQVQATEETASRVVSSVAGMNRDVAANYQGAGESMVGMAGTVQSRIGTMAINTSEQAAAACDLITRKFQEVNQAAQARAAGTPSGGGGTGTGTGGGMCNWGGGGGGLSGGNFPTDPMGASLISDSFRTMTNVNATMFRSRAAQQVQGIAPCLGDGGTIQQAGIAVVGEGGPEIVSLPRSAKVQPLQGGGGGGGIRDVHIHGVVVADQEGLRKLARMLNNIMVNENIRKGAST